MRRVSPVLITGLLFTTVACTDRDPAAPVSANSPSFSEATCELGLPDAEAIAALEALIAEVDALEADGKLNAGQANALRTHLSNVIRHVEAGRYCPALAQLAAFQEQVGNFVEDGVLDPADAGVLTDGATAVVEGPPPGPATYFVTTRPGEFQQVVYSATGAAFGPEPTAGGVGAPMHLVNDGSVSPTQGCGPYIGFSPGAIAVVDRGGCTFVSKALIAQAHGAVAVVVVNSVPGDPITMGGVDGDVTIPIVMVSQADGNLIKAGVPTSGLVSSEPPPTTVAFVTVNIGHPSPLNIPASMASFGPKPTAEGVTADIVLVDDGSALPTYACQDLIGFPAGSIALVETGGSPCTFVQQALNVQAAGAVAMIVIHPSGNPVDMGGSDPDVTIPSVMVSFNHGLSLKTMQPVQGRVSTEKVPVFILHVIAGPAVGFKAAIGATFGPPPTEQGVTALLVMVDDGSAEPTFGCEPLVGFPPGAIALIDRGGDCFLVDKAINAWNAGAAAVVIVNNSPTIFGVMGGDDPGITIPSIMISSTDGNAIKAGGLPVQAAVARVP